MSNSIPVYRDGLYTHTARPRGNHTWSGLVHMHGPNSRFRTSLDPPVQQQNDPPPAYEFPPSDRGDGSTTAPGTNVSNSSRSANIHLGDNYESSSPESFYTNRNTSSIEQSSSRRYPQISTDHRTLSQNQPTYSHSSSGPTHDSVVYSHATSSARTTQPSFPESFDWVELAAVSMGVHPMDVPYTPNNAFTDFTNFNNNVRALLRAYGTLRAHVTRNGSRMDMEVFENFEGELTSFFDSWRRREF